MRTEVAQALEEWQDTSDHLQDCAIDALSLALPGLDRTKTPTYCCPVTLSIDKPGDLGEGRVCIDTDTHATVEITDIPNSVICTAVDAVFGEAWFDEAEGPLEDEDPGTFHYDDEATGAEWIVEIGEGDTGKVHIECVPVPLAVELLDALATARAQELGEETPAEDDTAGR
jgi:hypothetical protein